MAKNKKDNAVKVTPKVRAQRTDKIRAKLYEDFYEMNKELYSKNRINYWHKASKYVDRHYREGL